MNEEAIIKLDHVNFWYERGKPSEYHALKDISLTIQRGEYAAFFGSSGSGKTSLLYLISGIEQSQDGTISINGRDISKFSRRELSIYRQVGVGMIFQQFNLIPSLTVVQNVMLPMSFLGVAEARARAEAMQLLDRVHLAELAERYPSELSGGQQQRVGIVRALANNPPIIVADEPLGNLDSENAQNVLNFLKELNEKDGRTVIMVTHEAWSLRDAKKIFLIKDGVVSEEPVSDPKTAAETLTKKMYGKAAPELTNHEVIAASLGDLLLRGYSAAEIKRFRFFLEQRMADKIEPEIFRAVLDRPWREGGLGLWRQKAQKVSQWVEMVMREEDAVGNIYKQLEKNPEAPLGDDVAKLRAWLLADYHGQVSPLQIEQITRLIVERIRGVITSEEAFTAMSLPRSKSGLGFASHTAQKIIGKLDLVLGQGHPALGSFAPTSP